MNTLIVQYWNIISEWYKINFKRIKSTNIICIFRISVFWFCSLMFSFRLRNCALYIKISALNSNKVIQWNFIRFRTWNFAFNKCIHKCVIQILRGYISLYASRSKATNSYVSARSDRKTYLHFITGIYSFDFCCCVTFCFRKDILLYWSSWLDFMEIGEMIFGNEQLIQFFRDLEHAFRHIHNNDFITNSWISIECEWIIYNHSIIICSRKVRDIEFNRF